MAKGKELRKLRHKKTDHIRVGKVTAEPDYDLFKPLFSFKYINYLGDNCISRCAEEKKALILSKLLRLSQSIWQEIKKMSKDQGFEPIPQFRFTATVPLPENLTPEATILVARYDGDGGRIAGFRDKDIYHIVLVGRNLYSH